MNTAQAIVGSTDEKYIAAWNFVVSEQAGDYSELMWSRADTVMQLVTVPAKVSPARPGVASVLLTVTQVR